MYDFFIIKPQCEQTRAEGKCFVTSEQLAIGTNIKYYIKVWTYGVPIYFLCNYCIFYF